MRYGLWQPQCYASEPGKLRQIERTKKLKAVPHIRVVQHAAVTSVQPGAFIIQGDNVNEFMKNTSDHYHQHDVAVPSVCRIMGSNYNVFNNMLEPTKDKIQQGDIVNVRIRTELASIATGEHTCVFACADVQLACR
jgi:hypothetical protein